MGVKEFFKPGPLKILLFFLFLFLCFSALFISSSGGSSKEGFSRLFFYITVFLALPLYGLEGLLNIPNESFILIFALLYFGLGLFWCYFLACFFFWLFSKFKKKPSENLQETLKTSSVSNKFV